MSTATAVLGATGLTTLIFAFINFLKFVQAKDWNSALTQLIVWASGIGGTLVVGASQFASSINLFGSPLNKLDWVSKVVIGLFGASTATGLNETHKAIDSTQSAVKPALFPALLPSAPAPEPSDEEIRAALGLGPDVAVTPQMRNIVTGK